MSLSQLLTGCGQYWLSFRATWSSRQGAFCGTLGPNRIVMEETALSSHCSSIIALLPFHTVKGRLNLAPSCRWYKGKTCISLQQGRDLSPVQRYCVGNWIPSYWPREEKSWSFFRSTHGTDTADLTASQECDANSKGSWDAADPLHISAAPQSSENHFSHMGCGIWKHF